MTPVPWPQSAALLVGMPIVYADHLWDGDVLVVRDPPGAGQSLVIGTRPLTWIERTVRAAARRNIADVYRWVGLPVPDPDPTPGRDLAFQIRREAVRHEFDGLRCAKCGSGRFLSVSLNGGYTRRAQCVPCGAYHPTWRRPGDRAGVAW